LGRRYRPIGRADRVDGGVGSPVCADKLPGHTGDGVGLPGGLVDEHGHGVAIAIGRDYFGFMVAVQVAEGDLAG
jgi:hypothetical protein